MKDALGDRVFFQNKISSQQTIEKYNWAMLTRDNAGVLA
jgi:hypothetical protein